MGLTFANYVLQPFFDGDCMVPVEAAQLLAGATICKFNKSSIWCYSQLPQSEHSFLRGVSGVGGGGSGGLVSFWILLEGPAFSRFSFSKIFQLRLRVIVWVILNPQSPNPWKLSLLLFLSSIPLIDRITGNYTGITGISREYGNFILLTKTSSVRPLSSLSISRSRKFRWYSPIYLLIRNNPKYQIPTQLLFN